MPARPLTPNLAVPPDLVVFPGSKAPVAATVTIDNTAGSFDAPLDIDGTAANIILESNGTTSHTSNTSIVNAESVVLENFGSVTSNSSGSGFRISGAATTEVDPGSITSFSNASELSITGTSAPELVFIGLGTFNDGQLDVSGNASLSSLELTTIATVTDGFLLDASACAIPSANVNEILAVFLAAVTGGAVTTGTIDLSGGTNGAPTGQGILDKAALILAGITVTTN